MLQIKKIAGALGAEVYGVDLAAPLSADIVAEIRAALLAYLVVFFRDQNLTAAQFLAFARTLGKPIEYPLIKGLPDYPDVIEVAKLEHEKANFGGIWHSDTTYLDRAAHGLDAARA